MFIRICLLGIVCECTLNYFALVNQNRLDNEYHIKISDFGLCRDVYNVDMYVRTERRRLPIRTIPPDSYKKYTYKSDVVRIQVYDFK